MSHSNWEDTPLLTVNPLKLRREAATFGRFAVVGLIGAVIDFGVLNLLIFGAGWSSPLQMVGANVVSTSAAILSNFFLNRNWTFRGAGGERRAQFLQFLAVSAAGLVINATVFYLANHYIFGPLLHTGFAVQLSKAAAIGVGMFWNFIVNRLWTFRHKAPPSKGNTAMSAPDVLAAQAAGASPDGSLPQAGAEPAAARRPRPIQKRWLLPLGVGLLLLAALNLGLYKRLAGPAAAPAAPEQAAAQAAPAAPAADAAPTAAPAAETAAPAPAVVAASSGPLAAGDLRLSAAFVNGSAPSEWTTLAGDWQVIDNAYVQTQREGFDRITLHSGEFANYVLRVRFKLLEGTGAGVLLNVPDAGSKNGGHLVRFTDDGAGLFWGRFDEAGAFTGQGYAATGGPGTDWHVLEVFSGAGSYAIHLNGVALAQDVPLLSTAGHIGLTTSQSTAAFAAVDVFDLAAGAAVVAVPTVAPEAPPAEDLASSGLEFSTINGDWVQEGGVIRQENSTATDFSLGTGVSAENYTLETAITLPADPDLADAGGGILFHMQTRDSKEGAQMVRFVNGGKGLTWGYFDVDGGFTGQGYVDLNLPPGEPQRLALSVRGDQFDVLINGEPVVQEVPTAAQSGWIGLISYRGPVTFAEVKLAVGSVVP